MAHFRLLKQDVSYIVFKICSGYQNLGTKLKKERDMLTGINQIEINIAPCPPNSLDWFQIDESHDQIIYRSARRYY